MDAAVYDTVTFAIPVTVDYGSGFEDLTKPGYATGHLDIGGISWEFAEAMIGSDPGDFKNGTRSVRLRGYGASALTMLADLSGGIGTITFEHRRFGTDAQIAWVVEYSTNQGASWTEIGRFTPGENVTTFSATTNVAAPARVRIRAAVATGTSNRRANIDDLVITAYTAGGEGMTFNQWSGDLAPTPELVMVYGIGAAADPQSVGAEPVPSWDGGWLEISALVRTNDPSLTVVGEAVEEVIDFGGAAVATIEGQPADDQTGVPEGHQHQRFRVPADTPQKFLRLHLQLAP
jgi:hypothetical protein